MKDFEKIRLAALADCEQDLAELRKGLATQLSSSEAAWGALIYLREMLMQQVAEIDGGDTRFPLTEFLDLNLSLLGLLTIKRWSCESPEEFWGEVDEDEFRDFI
jgi:hypothetical protein